MNEENEINLIFDKTISGLAGNDYGYTEYKNQLENKIDYSKLNIIIFPENIKKVAISFVQGMFQEILKQVNKEEIEKYIQIKTSYPKLTNKIIDNIMF